MLAEVVELGPHAKMTPDEALACAARGEWHEVIICGYKDGNFCVSSSRMSRETALWFAKQLELYALDL